MIYQDRLGTDARKQLSQKGCGRFTLKRKRTQELWTALMADGGLQGGLTEPHIITLTDDERCANTAPRFSFPRFPCHFFS
eukprot:COSAG06_NODE_1307_length_9916_cov_99.462361_8_plen_80_part_00